MKMDLNQALEQLASAFNTTVEKLYPLLIKQAYISGALELLMVIALLAVLIIAPITIWKKWDAIYDADVEIPVISVTVIFALIAVFVIPIGFHSGLTALLNPEYWALKEVLSYIK